MGPPVWSVKARLMQLTTRWFTLLRETLMLPDGATLDYWRVERADSAIVLPLHQGHILLPPCQYRPGIGAASLDFPGGRVQPEEAPATAAQRILAQELGLSPDRFSLADRVSLIPLNPAGWPINSSFSNQRLFGFVAIIDAAWPQSALNVGSTYAATSTGISTLLEQLLCLQCRMVLSEALRQAPIKDTSLGKSNRSLSPNPTGDAPETNQSLGPI